MKFHRQIYASNALLQKKAALSKVLDIMKSATGNTDRALDVANASSAVLADQLYESRAIAMKRNQLVVVPDIPRPTLLSVLRGKIEDTTGAALLQQGNAAEAIIRFRRAISVLPEKSAWWRASVWRLGSALAADGKDKEALDSYIKSYVIDKPDNARYATIEALYRKVNGNTDGLEARIGVNPAPPPPPVAEKDKQAETPAPKTEAVPDPKPAEITEKDKTAVEPAAQKPAIEEPKPESTPDVKPAASPEIKEDVPARTEPVPASTPAAEPTESTKPPEVKQDVPVEKAGEPKTGPDPAKPAEKKDKPKELFEPIIITIPSAGNKTDKPAETPKQPEPPAKETDNSGAGRARVVAEKSDKEEPPKCTLTLSQENVSLLNDGGSIGILVGIEGAGDIKDLTATSSSPRDVTVVLDPGIGGARKAFYVIKSVSVVKGLYTIVFESPTCGKREVAVKVN
jgi:tetratricopeptide (TPR) repeat protein